MNNKSCPDSVGKNEEEAKQDAANKEANWLESDESDNKESYSFSSASFSPVTHDSIICGLREFPENVCNNKEEKEDASAKHKEHVFDENGNGGENLNTQDLSLNHLKLSTSSETETTAPVKNYIDLLNEHSQKLGDSNFGSQIHQYTSTSPSQMSESTDHTESDLSSEQSNINAMEKPSETKSRFLEDFDSIIAIGKGGFGRVNKARRKLEKKYFAVKVVKFSKKAPREVTTLSRLEHANIVRYYTSWTEETPYINSSDSWSSSSSDSGTVEGARKFLYIQMEFCEGKTLREWIQERNSNPEQYPDRRQEAAKIIKQVLEAVKYIHSMKLIHRDLKPANIMLGQEGSVKVVDFGLVAEEEEEDDGRRLKRTKSAGTRSYMSPEQREQPTYGRKVDIFPVGLIYFELLWSIGTQNEKQKIWDNIRSKKFPEQFSEMFDFEHSLIERMLCDDPERRPEASDLLRELDQHLATTAEHT